jgi:hypothetical protein
MRFDNGSYPYIQDMKMLSNFLDANNAPMDFTN